MKTIPAKLSFSVLIYLLFPFILFAQPIKKTVIDVTKYSALQPYYTIDPAYPEEEAPPHLIEAEFYPLGFSKAGKFAYLIIPPDEAQGFLTVELVVQNLVNDKIAFKKVYEFDDDENRSKNYPRDFKSFIANHQSDIERVKKRHHITTQRPFLITCFSDLTLNSKKSFATKDGLGKFLSHLILQMNNKKGLSKTIYNKKITDYAFNSVIAGFFASPYEERVAILLMSIHRGWEGPPNTIKFNVVGASLATGFR